MSCQMPIFIWSGLGWAGSRLGTNHPRNVGRNNRILIGKEAVVRSTLGTVFRIEREDQNRFSSS